MFIHVLWNVFSEIKTSYLILSYLILYQKCIARTYRAATLPVFKTLVSWLAASPPTLVTRVEAPCPTYRLQIPA